MTTGARSRCRGLRFCRTRDCNCKICFWSCGVTNQRRGVVWRSTCRSTAHTPCRPSPTRFLRKVVHRPPPFPVPIARRITLNSRKVNPSVHSLARKHSQSLSYKTVPTAASWMPATAVGIFVDEVISSRPALFAFDPRTAGHGGALSSRRRSKTNRAEEDWLLLLLACTSWGLSKLKINCKTATSEFI